MDAEYRTLIAETIDKRAKEYTDLSDEIWGYAESRFLEYESVPGPAGVFQVQGIFGEGRPGRGGDRVYCRIRFRKAGDRVFGRIRRLIQPAAGGGLHGAPSDPGKRKRAWLRPFIFWEPRRWRRWTP